VTGKIYIEARYVNSVKVIINL